MQLPKDEDIYYIVKNGVNNKYYDLLYKRGYLISEKKCVVKSNWNSLNIGGRYYVTFDPLNEYAYLEDGNHWVFILGTAMDTILWHMDLNKIAHNIINFLKKSKNSFYDYIDYLNGRHIIVWGDEQGTHLLQDATGMRSVFYNKQSKLIASHYNLINDIIHLERNPFMKKYLEMTPTPWILPGNSTPVKDIYALTPNHEIYITDMSIHRFWPRQSHSEFSLNEVMNYISDCLKKELKCLNDKYKLMFQLTKGNDSRITLSACKDLIGSDYPLFYSYQTMYDPSCNEDAEFTKMLARKLSLNFKMVDLDTSVCSNADYEQLYSIAFVNHYHKHVFKAIPAYNKELPETYMNVRSNLVEIIRANYYADLPNAANAHDWVRSFYSDYKDDPEIKNIYKEYFNEYACGDIYNYLSADIIYWELRMGLWMNNAVLLKDDLNFDTFMLFNQRKILEYGLSCPRYYKQSNYLVTEVIKRLWPELLYWQPNTNYTLSDYYQPDVKGFVSFCTSSVERAMSKNAYQRTGRYTAELGFAGNKVIKGDSVQWSTKWIVDATSTFAVQVTLFVPAIYRLEPQYSDVIIKINDEVVYRENCNSFCNKDNQINVIQRFKKGETCNFVIELLAKENHTSLRGIPGFLMIRSIVCSPTEVRLRDDEKRRVISTANMFKRNSGYAAVQVGPKKQEVMNLDFMLDLARQAGKQEVYQSISWKVGRIVTWLPRQIKKVSQKRFQLKLRTLKIKTHDKTSHS